ncbi:MAG: AhpC/TSA family protein [Odoribacteraceae bacterium]|nr:AhpC/TSA family protein [Odoribacteraceae bacterium]
MKKILFLLLFASFLLSGFMPAKLHFTIKGTVDRSGEWRVRLVTPGDDPVTIAESEIVDGKFFLEGEVEQLTAAIVKLAHKKYSRLESSCVTVFLEEGEYEVNVGKEISTVKGGGDEQKIGSAFEELRQTHALKEKNIQLNYNNRVPKTDTLQRLLIEIDDACNDRHRAEMFKKLIIACQDSYAAAYYALTMTEERKEEVDALMEKYALLGDRGKATEHGQRILALIKKREHLARGRVAPDFTMETPDGKSVSMHSIRGKVKLIDFWASWCGPCRKENPMVKKLYEEYHSKGLEIVSVSCDKEPDKEAWLKAIQEDGLTWPQGWTPGWDAPALRSYLVTSIPFTVLVDKKNRIIAIKLRGKALHAKIAELLD